MQDQDTAPERGIAFYMAQPGMPAVPLAEALRPAGEKRAARKAGWLPALGRTSMPMETREWGVRGGAPSARRRSARSRTGVDARGWGGARGLRPHCGGA